VRTKNCANNPILKGLLILTVGILLVSTVDAGQWNIWVRPSVNGSLQVNQNFNYSYLFSNDSSCSTILYQTETKNVSIDEFGMGFLSFQLPSNLTNAQYFCEYRNSSLRATLPVTTQLANNSFAIDSSL